MVWLLIELVDMVIYCRCWTQIVTREAATPSRIVAHDCVLTSFGPWILLADLLGGLRGQLIANTRIRVDGVAVFCESVLTKA
jgi:hypothetical protein